MEERLFRLRSRAVHEGDNNDLVRLDIEMERDGQWQPVMLGTISPPFRTFVCAALMCQHAYLRMNASERGLLLGDTTGELWMKTEDWVVRDLTAHFVLRLRQGTPSADDLTYIRERTRDCPISRNLAGATKDTTIELAG